jgi:hypothetical protein
MTELMLDELGQRREPERGVDDEIAVTATHVPATGNSARLVTRGTMPRPSAQSQRRGGYEQPLVLPQLGQA